MLERLQEEDDRVTYSVIEFPLVFVLSQDCDLEQDYRYRWGEKQGSSHDKFLFSVLVAPLYNAQHVYNGEHLTELNMSMNNKISKSDIKSNQMPRYHYLDFPPELKIPAAVIDFKHYFSVNIEDLKKNYDSHFVCKVAELYRESVSQRFANFLSRIGLPS
jgi:hypothetical protein